MKCYVEEFIGSGGRTDNVAFPVAAQPSQATDVVTSVGTSVQSEVFGTQTWLVRLHVDGPCCYAFGVNPTATLDSPRMPEGAVEYFSVQPGHRVAVIETT